jgi:hypothetical protein
MNTLAELQQQFAKSLRDPQSFTAKLLNIESRRHTIYQELIFKNISSLLAGTFPVLHKTLSPTVWNALIREFLIQHRAKTPLFPELSAEFLQFIQQGVLPDSTPLWLPELAHYEWIELALELTDIEEVDSLLKAELPHLSPLAISLKYRFPVNKIGPDFQPEENIATAPTCLLAYRAFDYGTHEFSEKVNFMSLTPAAARLLELLDKNSNIDQLSQELANELKLTTEKVKIFVLQFLTALSEKGIIFGLRENT